MEVRYALAALCLLAAVAAAGCVSSAPAATPTPLTMSTATLAATPAPLQTSTVTLAASPMPAAVTVTPTPGPTPTPAPTPWPVYQDWAPVGVTHIQIFWDTTDYTGEAEESPAMVVENMQNDSVALDVEVDYSVSTPVVLVNADGTHNTSVTTITKSDFIGLMQPGERRNVTFQVDHAKNVPATVTITLKWRGGSTTVFERTLDLPDNSYGMLDY